MNNSDMHDRHATATAERGVRVRRSAERGYEDLGWADHWLTFSFDDYHDPDWGGFGPLRVMVENHIQPHAGFPPHAHRDVEIVTYVAEGTLSHRDNFGHSASIPAGAMQHISAGSRGMVHAEENLRDEVEHNYQMWLVPERLGTGFAFHERGFAPEEREGTFRLYVSPDGREGSMPINADALIYAGLFAPGDRVERTLEAGRGAWIQVVRGAVDVADVTLATGDGVGITDAERVELAFREDSEVLLLDLRMDAPMSWR